MSKSTEDCLTFFKRQSAIISLDNSETFGINSSFVVASNFPDNKGRNLELKRIWATCSSTMPPFSSTTSISSNWSQKSIISSSIKGQGILQAKKPIPLYFGFLMPIRSKASIVSVAAFPTEIIPSFFF